MPLPFASVLGIQFMAGAWISLLPAWLENSARLLPGAALQKPPWKGRKEKQLFHPALPDFPGLPYLPQIHNKVSLWALMPSHRE